MIFFLLPQAVPVQEERNGPTASSKSQEPSTNHTGSGDLTFDPLTLHPLSPRPREDKPSLVFSLFSGCGVTSSENRKLATVRRTLQRLFSSSTSSSGQSEIQVLDGAQIDLILCCRDPPRLRRPKKKAQIGGGRFSSKATSLMRWEATDLMQTCGVAGETVSAHLVTACVAIFRSLRRVFLSYFFFLRRRRRRLRRWLTTCHRRRCCTFAFLFANPKCSV